MPKHVEISTSDLPSVPRFSRLQTVLLADTSRWCETFLHVDASQTPNPSLLSSSFRTLSYTSPSIPKISLSSNDTSGRRLYATNEGIKRHTTWRTQDHEPTPTQWSPALHVGDLRKLSIESTGPSHTWALQWICCHPPRRTVPMMLHGRAIDATATPL